MNAYVKLELWLDPPQPASDIATAWLCELGFDMFETVETGLIAHGDWNALGHDQIRAVVDRISSLPDVHSLKHEISQIETTNWNATWESDYQPIDIEGMACMRAPFHSPPEKGLDLIIQPQMSFGTGHHATTWQMLRYLMDLKLEGTSVLDMGCGTGALAIAARLLGASQVVAIDVDEWSVENTKSNLQLNGLNAGADVQVIHGNASALDGMGGAFDVVCANINRNVLLADWSAYNQALRSGGIALMSGFFPSDVPHLEQAARAHNWSKVVAWEREGWACVKWIKS